ncbi:MAG: hypothetical protein COV07_04395 [Candidatus Vogelbacteria bacterium CG10_big_fil_rev_8_21_14_0_10_45_14]|uniref:Uncharacterized protein n=1 Tax=Candidatus Vogelbacteria bacterium CG10_big_fil_rev_8_21_14_0_10_45_14 TaxID=1975042 RepID=A0A2H0RIJ5_9BACT|nr:MAG: hypothetical protein COV07_04395 [Candidatus Vogelbacteria bacterium CG10_big_fil_rev_8_21_14_0_10_45_14]
MKEEPTKPNLRIIKGNLDNFILNERRSHEIAVKRIVLRALAMFSHLNIRFSDENEEDVERVTLLTEYLGNNSEYFLKGRDLPLIGFHLATKLMPIVRNITRTIGCHDNESKYPLSGETFRLADKSLLLDSFSILRKNYFILTEKEPEMIADLHLSLLRELKMSVNEYLVSTRVKIPAIWRMQGVDEEFILARQKNEALGIKEIETSIFKLGKQKMDLSVRQGQLYTKSLDLRIANRSKIDEVEKSLQEKRREIQILQVCTPQNFARSFLPIAQRLSPDAILYDMIGHSDSVRKIIGTS